MLHADSGGRLSRDFHSALWIFDPRYPGGAAPDFGDNTTTAISGHTYMSSWPSWPFLMRPVWYLFDKLGDDRIAAVVFLGNPLILWPALVALAICLRDWIVTRRADAFLVLAFYFGPWLAWALLPRTLGFIYYYLPAATTASFALVYALTGQQPRAGCCGPSSRSGRRLRRHAADIGRVRRDLDGDVQPPDDLPELDLRRRGTDRLTSNPLTGPLVGLLGLAVDARVIRSNPRFMERAACGPSLSVCSIRRCSHHTEYACCGNRN